MEVGMWRFPQHLCFKVHPLSSFNESSLYNQGGAYCEMNEQEPETVRLQGNNDGSSPSNSNAGNSVHESCFPFLMADGENLWENYGLKLNKGNHNQ